MLDIRSIRENAELVKKKAGQKGYKVNIKHLSEMKIIKNYCRSASFSTISCIIGKANLSVGISSKPKNL